MAACVHRTPCELPPLPKAPDLGYLAETALDHGPPVGADVYLQIDTLTDAHPISRYVYGGNFRRTGAQNRWNAAYFDGGVGMTLARLGGNRLTSFNWENGASSSGADLAIPRNDDYLGDNRQPGDLVAEHVDLAHCEGAAALLTVPMLGLVAADRRGTIDAAQGRFVISRAWAEGDPSVVDPRDGVVEQQAFVHWARKTRWPGSGRDREELFFALDNEPSLWRENHPLLRERHLRYDEMVDQTVRYARMVKAVDPRAVVFGGVLYGWNSFTTLQNAPDAAGRDFLDVFLAGIHAASPKDPLVDVLDLHWYPEVAVEEHRIIEDVTSPELAAVRVQAPRSLWDPTYVESSWIADSLDGGAIALLPRVQAKIDTHAPGTRIALSEYSYGSESTIDGGLAQADTLGILGREDVFAASWWPKSGEPDYVLGAFQLFRNMDGLGAAFGDISVQASTSDVDEVTVYASVDGQDPDRVVLVIVNKSLDPRTASVTVRHTRPLDSARSFVMTSGVPAPVPYPLVEITGRNAYKIDLPAYSASAVELSAATTAGLDPPHTAVDE